jgi:hypothetical protein
MCYHVETVVPDEVVVKGVRSLPCLPCEAQIALAQRFVREMQNMQDAAIKFYVAASLYPAKLLSETIGSEDSDGDGAQPSEEDLTKVKERDGNKVAEKEGFKDAHEAKKGRGEGGVDIYRDKSNGKHWLWNGTKGAEKERL